MLRWPLLASAVLVSLLALFIHAALRSPITPRPLPLPSSLFTPNNLLQGVEKLGEGVLEGPEDVCFDGEGTLYTATSDGWIKRMHANGSWEGWRFVGGQGVLGITLSAAGGLLVCDTDKFVRGEGHPIKWAGTPPRPRHSRNRGRTIQPLEGSRLRI